MWACNDQCQTVGWVARRIKNLNIIVLLDIINVLITFRDLYLTWRSQQCQTVLIENVNCYVLIHLSLCDYSLLWLDHEYTTIFYFHAHSREIIDVFPDLARTLTWLFLGHDISEGLQTLHGYNLALGLLVHCRFVDPWPCFSLDIICSGRLGSKHQLTKFVSRSWVCQ